jgi:hypothetical protein
MLITAAILAGRQSKVYANVSTSVKEPQADSEYPFDPNPDGFIEYMNSRSPQGRPLVGQPRRMLRVNAEKL